jgi:hypoxanthine phosphoribosyltransferase
MAEKTSNGQKKYSCDVWSDGIFRLNQHALESLLTISESGKCVDYVIVILSPDDDLTYRNTVVKSPRDNVVFEMGLCIGLLGLKRTIIVSHDNIKLPTDIKGINRCIFNDTDKISVKKVVKDIDYYISSENKLYHTIQWNEYKNLINKFEDKIKFTNHNGNSYAYDAILSASRSGTMAAELISRKFGFSLPVYYIVKGRGDGYGLYDYHDVKGRNMDTANQMNEKRHKTVLLIDGLVDKKLRKTMHNALNFLKEHCPRIIFKTGALIADKKFENDKDNAIDFVAEYREDSEYVTWFYKYFK